MQNEIDKLKWLEDQLAECTEESLIKEVEQLESEIEQGNINIMEPPEGFYEEVINKGRQIERNQLIRKYIVQDGEFEDICPSCGGKLHILNQTDQEQDKKLQIWCEECGQHWV